MAHWDRKISSNIKTGKKQDRLVVTVTGYDNKDQLLGAPELPSGTGEAQADAVYKLLVDWDMVDQVTSICSDTTASNTGVRKGACQLLQSKIGKKLFYFACRHHMLECILSATFDSQFEVSTGPVIQFFNRFKEYWPNIKDKTKFDSSFSDSNIWEFIHPQKAKKTKFILEQLKISHSRGDYTELLELALLFIGKPDDIKIKVKAPGVKAPGAVHRARFMGKIIYCLKIYLFRHHFNLSNNELEALRIFNVFVVTVYL